jgi:hypothetical protein
MKWFAFVVFVVVVIACGAYYGRPARVMKRIVDSREVLIWQHWQQEPWSRIDDEPSGPYFLLIADDGTACLVPDSVWAVTMPGRYHRCHTSWRVPRVR